MDNLQQSKSHQIGEQKNNFVSQPTPFIGRKDDLHKLQEMLAQPGCRLISLVGSGGIGKTRLGIEVATQASHHFKDGAYFVPLQGLTSMQQLAPAIAKSTACELFGKQDTLSQLKRYLHDKEMLIVLDNFEHLLDATNMVVDLLDEVTGLKVLVTSREVLSLRAEWVWSVTGMRFPDNVADEIEETDSAVHLFNSYAQRLLPGFSLELEKAYVIRICQLVGGVPLAIELAASWLKSVSCERIAEEIQRNLDFLATNMRDMPERHRNMNAVIDQSWQLLTEQEQDIFTRLSIFRGGFHSEAYDRSIGASRVMLSSLVDKSMVSYNGRRYHLHELLRQYAQQRLAMRRDKSEQLLEAHASYYVQFLADRLHTFRSKPDVLDEILIEMDNIYLAWESVVSGQQFDELPAAIYCFGGVLNYAVSRHEGIELLAPAIQTYRTFGIFPETLPIYAALLTTQALCHASLMQLTEAIALLEECQGLLDEYGFRPQAYARSDPLILLGIAHLYQGEFDDALRYGYQAVAEGEKHQDLSNGGMANQVLGMTYLALGQVEQAMQFGQIALSRAKQTGDLANSAFCSDHLGDTAMLSGDPATAEYYYTEGYHYRQEINELLNLPLSMSLIGKAKLAQGQYEEAAEWLIKSISIYTAYADTASLIVPKSQLATCYACMNDLERARHLFAEAIHAANLTQVVPLWLVLITHVAEFLIQQSNYERGVELLSTVIHHPMFNRGRDIVIDVEKKLDEIENMIPEDQFLAALQAGIDGDFEVMVLALMEDISKAVVNIASKPVSEDHRELYAKGIEPLSERELEVLALIARGMTNQDIAEALIVTIGTVKSHTHSIYSKMGVKNRTQAIKIASENRLI